MGIRLKRWMAAGILGIFSQVSAAQAVLLLGQERLEQPEFQALLAGKRIGVLAHHASRDRNGQHLVDRLVKMPCLHLVVIFAPEHGYRGIDDTRVGDTFDPATGLPVYSLYGPRRAPTVAMLRGIDLLLIDLQDVGLRYYTYPATVVDTLRAAKAAGIPVWLLDRPNPLGGLRVDGLALEPALTQGGLTTIASIPTRHGMTLGELSLYLNQHLKIGADLKVVPMEGWTRNMDWKATEIPWTPPSPALLRPEQVTLYALLGSLESGHLAVGRGQDNSQAFEIFGAPWITPAAQKTLVARLQALQLRGLQFSAHEWRPDRSIFQGQLCRGFRVQLTEGIELNSFEPLIAVLQTMRATLGSAFQLGEMATMVGSRQVMRDLQDALSSRAASESADRDSKSFLRDRAPFLLYPEAGH